METAPVIDLQKLRTDFPVLHQHVNGYPLVYFDNAATTQKPKAVIDSIVDYYSRYNSNIHRGAHHLAHTATVAFEATREKVRELIHARETAEIIFTSGTTDGVNLVAQSWARRHLVKGDEILLSMLEHHSNIVPWQLVAEEVGAQIRVIPINDSGEWELSGLDQVLGTRTRLVAVNHVSNALGTINPVKELITKAHAAGAVVLVDGAQAVAHFPVDVQDLGCDFYCFSAHKMYGPTGVGVLYGRRELLEAMPPYRGGGEMIHSVSFEKTTYNDLPHKFEAGTPHIEGVIALSAAIDYLRELGWTFIHDHEQLLLHYATAKLSSLDGVQIYGTSKNKVGVISFLVDGTHPYDLGTLLDKQGIAVRTGQHCTEPLWNYCGVVGSVRASFAVYNTTEEVDIFINALEKAVMLLKG